MRYFIENHALRPRRIGLVRLRHRIDAQFGPDF
jgi:hypothetical protein